MPADEPANIALHFDNGDIYGVIKIIADSLNLNYAIDPAVKGTVNITTNSSVKRSELLPILETILKLNGATMVRNGKFTMSMNEAIMLRMGMSGTQGTRKVRRRSGWVRRKLT